MGHSDGEMYLASDLAALLPLVWAILGTRAWTAADLAAAAAAGAGARADALVAFVATYTTDTGNWGLAAALGLLMLVTTLVLYAAAHRLSGGRVMAVS